MSTEKNLFSEALETVEPLLRAMTNNLSSPPKASKKSLARIFHTDSSRGAANPDADKEDDELRRRLYVSYRPRSNSSLTQYPSGVRKPQQDQYEISGLEKLRSATNQGALKKDSLSRSQDDRLKKLALLKKEALSCTRCPHLVASRTQVVFGIGNPYAELMFVGEAPGEEEDLRGEPFVGRAGQLLTKIINAMEYQREDIFIANVLKCRPNMPPGVSGNRKPKPDEMSTCLPWLKEQIALIQPRVLVALGATAVEGLLGKPLTMREARGHWFDFESIPLMVTYHPAYLLRNQSLSEKRKVWEDMLQVLEKLERPISQKQRDFFLPK